MGTTEAPTMASPRSPTVDKIPPTRDYQGGTDQQHSLCQTISNTMVQRLLIWHRGIKWKWPSMVMENTWCMAWETHVEPPRITNVSSDHLNDHPSIGTGVTYPGIHRQFKRTRLDAQSIIWPSEHRIPRCISTLDWMDTRQSREIPILTTHQRNIKHHPGLPLKGFP